MSATASSKITVADIAKVIERYAPLYLQESYDNAGLQVGNSQQDIDSALVCLDVTEDIIDEAVALGCKLVITHHPLIFKGVKKVVNSDCTGRIIAKAIKNDIAIYSAHTNLDNTAGGVSHEIASRIGLENVSVLVPMQHTMLKFVVFTPISYAAAVRAAAFGAGAGELGNYDACSFTVEGKGTFRALDGSNPYTGETNVLHTEPEVRQEFLISPLNRTAVINAVLEAHPYEEPAYDIISLENESKYYGTGAIGTISPVKVSAYLNHVKKALNVSAIRYSGNPDAEITTVAVCGGSGATFIRDAAAKGAGLYITGDIKYHDFASAPAGMAVADIGHFESELITNSIFYRIISEKFPNFALYFSKIEKNPINYL